jgi:hypothetical protein
MAQLRLKNKDKETEAVRELMIRCLGGSTLNLDYPPKPTLRLKPKAMGASSTSANLDRYISQSVTELLSRTVV